MTENSSQTTHYHACNLCEAICGLEIVLEGEQIISIKGDKKDPLSNGHICPKAIALQDIYNDPDRLRLPVKKTDDGWQTLSWNQAYDEVTSNLKKIQKQHGKNAVGVYQGNPTVHNLEGMLFSSAFTRTLRTKNHFSATSVDQLPEQLVSSEMFGHSLLIPLPDLDRTEFVIIIGGNPVVSNGSLMTAPGVKKRLVAISKRGGKVVVIDPRKTETAAIADQHIFVKPGTDALMMLAMLQYLFSEKLQSLGTVSHFTKDLKVVENLVKEYTPESVAEVTGVPAEILKSLVRNFCVAGSATCYGRIGVSTHEYGTLTQWLIVVFNIVTGNLDFPGGTMFSKPAFDFLARSSKKKSSKKKSRKDFGSAFSRVRKLPNFNGEFPVATLAEEITTAGDGQIKALVTNSGNPVLSTPNSNKIDHALSQLDYMVSIDLFINETTRHANIILPPISALERSHYDIVFHSLAIRNTARFSKALFKPPKTARSDTQIFTELGWRMTSVNLTSKISGWFKKTIMQKLGSEYAVNSQLKKGPYGKSHNLSLKRLLANPHGIDLGPMKPCLPNRLFTSDKQINLAPEIFVKDVVRLRKQYLENSTSTETIEFNMLLIGRRDPRTNNSWLHNSLRMVKGKNRCTALIHPDDANKKNIEDGEVVHIKSRVGAINIAVSISDEMMPGVISIPHGWGHQMEGVELRVASEHAGINTNILTDELLLDAVSGNAALNGVPISLSKAP